MTTTTFTPGMVIPSTWLNATDATVAGALQGATTAAGVRSAIGAMAPADQLTGTIATGVTAVTQAHSDSSTKVATTAFVQQELGNTSYGGRKNKVINGMFLVDQRRNFSGASPISVVAGAALAYVMDRWYVYGTGANYNTIPYASSYDVLTHGIQLTGVGSVTSMGLGHRIESSNAQGLNGKTVVLSAVMKNTLLTTVNWAVYTATSIDSFGTLASPTRTLVSNGSWTVTSSEARHQASFAMPSAAVHGVEIVFTVGAQTSGAWYVTGVQLEVGSIASNFEMPTVGEELMLCQRYFPCISSDNTNFLYGQANCRTTTTTLCLVPFAIQARVSPTGITSTGTFSVIRADGSGFNGTLAFNSASTSLGGVLFTVGTGTPFTAGQGATLVGASGTQIFFTGCEL